MKVQGSAFYFGNEADADITKFGPFFAWLQGGLPGSEWPPHRPFIEGYAYRRRMFVNELDDAWCGVLISARATEFHHYVQQIGNVVNIVARSTGPNPPVEINFFCLRKDSHKGIYSHYYGSYAFGSFLSDLWHAYRFYVEQQCAEAVAANADGTEKEIKQKFSLRAKAQYSPLYNPNDFNRLVQTLASVFEVRLTTYSVDTASDRPVSDRISNVHKVYRLEEGRQQVDRALLSWIREKRNSALRQLANGKASFSGSVHGEDENGKEWTLPFNAFLDDHLNFDYDQIGSINVQQIAENPCLAAMIGAMRTGTMFRPVS